MPGCIKQMTNDSLYKYFRGDASRQEITDIERWLGESPANRMRFNEAQAMYAAMVMAAPLEVLETGQTKTEKRKKRRIITWVSHFSAAAAVLVMLVLASVYITRTVIDDRLAETMTTVSVPAGQRVNLTLQDGTNVWLNSGTSISYPSKFGRYRKVKVDGEALFDVANDEEHPFIVSTYACDVKVIGTRFNVLADEADNTFCTSLFRGKVQVVDSRTGQSVILSPEQSVEFRDGHLVRTAIESYDGLMWNDGIISLYGDTFKTLMRRFENAFGVNINVEGTYDPQMKTRGKVRVTEGVTHALDILKDYVDFRYDYDIDKNVITITLK